jgi:hypothetical protein
MDDLKRPDLKVSVGGRVEDDAAAFLHAWRRAERGEPVNQRVLAFESWEGLARVCAVQGGAFQWVRGPPGNRSSRKQPEQSWR